MLWFVLLVVVITHVAVLQGDVEHSMCTVHCALCRDKRQHKDFEHNPTNNLNITRRDPWQLPRPIIAHARDLNTPTPWRWLERHPESGGR
jgi:hypothetical protein